MTVVARLVPDVCQHDLPVGGLIAHLVPLSQFASPLDFTKGSDRHNVRVQSRSGCACAGPYGVSLMQPLIEGIIGQSPEAVVRALETPKNEWVKPGWMRVYFSHLMTPAEVDYVICSVLEVARDGWKLLPQYDCAHGSGASLRCDKRWGAVPSRVYQ
jgi:hypothetical protein